MTYSAPVRDILFTLNSILDLPARNPSAELDGEMLAAILDEAARFAEEKLAPLNRIGDETGARLVDGKVVLPEGWTEAYRQWADAGWGALTGDPEHGGQGLPTYLSCAVQEIWTSACLSFALAPMLTIGVIEALERHGSEAQKALYLPRLISGEWTGTMNLTEPQAGTDLAAVRTRAVPNEDGSYRLKGTKIFITYGEHEMTDNIIHMVLARLPDAPPGTRGISLFLVPKYLVDESGAIGERNDIACLSLEHKLGIHASPTCVMAYGENEGAIGYLVGEENRGLMHMFTMMNNARLGVGIQGVALAEIASQTAALYAGERKQGRAPGAAPGEMTTIVHHPDVRRMLMTQRSLTRAARAICLATGLALDLADSGPADSRDVHDARAALLTPIAKAFPTDSAVEVASIGIQVHGGMGFIEETGAAQYYRDARILPIYEGTNGVQAIDLVGRKLPMQGGEVMRDFIADLRDIAEAVMASNAPELGRTGYRLSGAVRDLEETSEWLLQTLGENMENALAGATPFQRLFALTAGGAYLAKGALAALQDETLYGDERREHVAMARFFAENLLPETAALRRIVMQAAASVLALAPEELTGRAG